MSRLFRSGRAGFAHDIGDLDADELAAAVEPNALADRAPDGVRRRSYDKAFEPAVARGLLTVQAAWARGSREAYAVGLQHRYQLTSALALEVADNSMTLLEALETLDRQNKGALSELTGTRTRFSWRLLPVALVMACALFVLARYGEGLWESHSRIGRELERLSFAAISKARPTSLRREPIGSPVVGPQVQRDELGRVTRVEGGRPIAVLEEICRLASASGSCPWMEVRHTEPRYPGLRIGRFAAGPGDGEIWAVMIRRNRSSGRWSVGTGLRPVQPFPEVDPRLPGLGPVPGRANVP